MTASQVLNIPAEGSADAVRRAEDIHIREILAIILAGKWTILPFVLVALAFAGV